MARRVTSARSEFGRTPPALGDHIACTLFFYYPLRSRGFSLSVMPCCVAKEALTRVGADDVGARNVKR